MRVLAHDAIQILYGLGCMMRTKSFFLNGQMDEIVDNIQMIGDIQVFPPIHPAFDFRFIDTYPAVINNHVWMDQCLL